MGFEQICEFAWLLGRCGETVGKQIQNMRNQIEKTS